MAGYRPRSSSTLSRASASQPPSQASAKRTPPAQTSAHLSFNCPLDDPDLGLVAMTDHQNRRCLCSCCTCGRHKCPGEALLSPYPKNMFASEYQQHHQAKTPLKALEIVRKERRENVNPMEMLTHNELSYRPFRIGPADITSEQAKSSGRPRPQSAGPHPKFAGYSTYHSDFPNWGSAHPYHAKHVYQKVPTQDLSFSGLSEYGNNYQPKDLRGLRAEAGGADAHSSITLHGSAIKLETRTTAKSEFQPFPGVHKPNSCKVTTLIPNFQPVPGAYSTEYAVQFVPRSPLLKNPQTVRRALLARGC